MISSVQFHGTYCMAAAGPLHFGVIIRVFIVLVGQRGLRFVIRLALLCISCLLVIVFVSAHIDPNMGDVVQQKHPKIRVEVGWGKQHKTCNISEMEMVQDRTKVTVTD